MSVAVPNAEVDALNITRDPFHGEWNYTIHPAETNAPAIDAVISG